MRHNQKALPLPERKWILGDFNSLVREADDQGQNEVAAVYVTAALEDSAKEGGISYVLDAHHNKFQ